MKLPAPLHRGTLIKRYKRFLADIRLDTGEEITAHCANPGSMMGVSAPGSPVWVSEHRDKKRKLPWSWQLVEVDGGTLVAINTSNPNAIAAEAIESGAIPELSGYDRMRREVKYGENSRIDLLLEDDRRGRCYVEIKNVHLRRRSDLAEFPDSVTARGAKHLRELIRVVEAGERAVMLFIVQRGDCRRLRPAADLDPAYAAAFAEAAASGVEMLAYDCEITTAEVILRRALTIESE
ncbi:MAG: DNA/RNA nuclease SfsA [Pseudomonadota bacterium]